MKYRKYIIATILLLLILLCAVGSAVWITSKSDDNESDGNDATAKSVYISKEYIELRTAEESKKSIEPMEMTIYGLNNLDNQLKTTITLKCRIADIDELQNTAEKNVLKVTADLRLTYPENTEIFKDESSFSIFARCENPIINEFGDTDIVNSRLKVEFTMDLSEENMKDDEFIITLDMRIGNLETYNEWRKTFLEDDGETIKGKFVFTFDINY